MYPQQILISLALLSNVANAAIVTLSTLLKFLTTLSYKNLSQNHFLLQIIILNQLNCFAEYFFVFVLIFKNQLLTANSKICKQNIQNLLKKQQFTQYCKHLTKAKKNLKKKNELFPSIFCVYKYVYNCIFAFVKWFFVFLNLNYILKYMHLLMKNWKFNYMCVCSSIYVLLYLNVI